MKNEFKVSLLIMVIFAAIPVSAMGWQERKDYCSVLRRKVVSLRWRLGYQAERVKYNGMFTAARQEIERDLDTIEKEAGLLRTLTTQQCFFRLGLRKDIVMMSMDMAHIRNAISDKVKQEGNELDKMRRMNDAHEQVVKDLISLREKKNH